MMDEFEQMIFPDWTLTEFLGTRGARGRRRGQRRMGIGIGMVSRRRDAELLDILSRRWDIHILIPFRR
jgi:hypothetical protein